MRVLRWLLFSFVLLFMALVGVGWWLWIPAPQEPPYRLVAVWGEKGTGPGQFNEPTGIAATETEVFVADARNARIQVFDHGGHFKRQFGSRGEGPGQVGRPMNLAIASNELYVADYWNDRIQVFGLDGTPQRTIGHSGSGSGEFNAPGGVAVAPNGDLYVADFYNQRIQQLRADGSFIQQWGETSNPGWRAGQFIYPTDVALSPDGTLYVADGYADRVQVFAPEGTFSHKWGGPLAINLFGPFNGWFTTVTSLAVGPKGQILVADFYNNRVQKFTSEGKFLTGFGLKDTPHHRPGTAIAVAVAPKGTVFVADFANHRIQKWRPRD